MKIIAGQEDAPRNDAPRKRGRPAGPTRQGDTTRRRLYDTAIALITTRGYEATTLRDVAARAGVSVGLLYRYFPSKRAVVLSLYDELSADYAEQAAGMDAGKWRDRFLFALATSLQILHPHRRTLTALVPVFFGGADEGLFAPGTLFSRRRVQAVFHEAVMGATDAPRPEVAAALGRLLYLVHLAVILWWMMDKSPKQRATHALVALIKQTLPASALTLRLPRIRGMVIAGDRLMRDALFDDAEA